MNKLWLFFYITMCTASHTFFLSAYDQGIRKERAHRKSYRAKIGALEQEQNSMQQEIASQQAKFADDAKVIANLKKENYSLKQDNKKILSALDADNVAAALQKINHLLTVHEHAKKIASRVHVMGKK